MKEMKKISKSENLKLTLDESEKIILNDLFNDETKKKWEDIFRSS